jgi:O-antigen/teichoic acid export membrane protein
VGVTLVAIYGVRGVNLAITLFVAAHLGPEGMGLLAAALIAVEFIDVVRDLGVREAIVYRPKLEAPTLVAARAMIAVVAAAQAVGMAAVALAYGRINDDANAAVVFAALAPLFLINAVGSLPDALLQRAGRFGARALAEVVAVAIKLCVALWLLSDGAGLWAMIAAILASQFTRSLALAVLMRQPVPLQLPAREEMRWLVSYGRNIVSSTLAFFLRLKSDQLAIATFLGESSLGLYFMAARLPELLVNSVNMAISTVAFPYFSRLGHDREGLSRAYLTTLSASMLVMAPVSIGAAVVGEPLLTLLLGPEWREAGAVLAILMLGGVPVTLGWSSGDVLKAQGRTDALARLMWLEALATGALTATCAFATGDLRPVAVAMLAGMSFGAALRLREVSRHVDVTVAATLRATAPAMAAAAGMGGAVWSVRSAAAGWGEAEMVALGIATGVATYGALIYALDRGHLTRLFGLLRPAKDLRQRAQSEEAS